MGVQDCLNQACENSQAAEWEAVAAKMTADSYATEAEDVVVKIYTSDGDGTYTATDTSEYSALHWSAKSLGGGDMYKSAYDADNSGVVDDSEKLGGVLPTGYSLSGHTHTNLIRSDGAVAISTTGLCRQLDLTSGNLIWGGAKVATENSVNTFEKAQRTISDEMFIMGFHSPATMDMEQGNDFYFNLIEGDLVIAAPINMADNQGGIIEIEQDATGGHAVTWNAIFSFMNTPSEDTAGLKRNYYAYHVNRGKILISYVGAI